MDLLVMLVVSNLTPWVLERLKDAAWFPLMQRFSRYAPILNRVTPVASTVLLTLGVHWSFEASGGGRLVLEGFVPTSDEVTKAGIVLASWAMQEYRYRRTIK
jgi:hypothetical protein